MLIVVRPVSVHFCGALLGPYVPCESEAVEPTRESLNDRPRNRRRYSLLLQCTLTLYRRRYRPLVAEIFFGCSAPRPAAAAAGPGAHHGRRAPQHRGQGSLPKRFLRRSRRHKQTGQGAARMGRNCCAQISGGRTASSSTTGGRELPREGDDQPTRVQGVQPRRLPSCLPGVEAASQDAR